MWFVADKVHSLLNITDKNTTTHSLYINHQVRQVLVGVERGRVMERGKEHS